MEDPSVSSGNEGGSLASQVSENTQHPASLTQPAPSPPGGSTSSGTSTSTKMPTQPAPSPPGGSTSTGTSTGTKISTTISPSTPVSSYEASSSPKVSVNSPTTMEPQLVHRSTHHCKPPDYYRPPS